MVAAISFARLQEDGLNHDARRTKITTRLAAPEPLVPPAINRSSWPKKLTREELCDRSAKGLCWNYDELWSHDHYCKKVRLLMIEPIEEIELEDMDLESEEDDIKEKPQSAVSTVHALSGYAKPYTMKIEESLKHQHITVLTDTRGPTTL
ncbi:hypothetical protein BHM03_00012430 [Ensete ventricosum]|uniref:Uncharacterized protein n=1 Tax=Ensete ventricosum TaxID=4639 RepID=A0A445MDN3_ENSVE|nr:hypothetical protein BHM03_00012430 [Ensete ventricosum]